MSGKSLPILKIKIKHDLIISENISPQDYNENNYLVKSKDWNKFITKRIPIKGANCEVYFQKSLPKSDFFLFENDECLLAKLNPNSTAKKNSYGKMYLPKDLGNNFFLDFMNMCYRLTVQGRPYLLAGLGQIKTVKFLTSYAPY